MFKTDSIEKAHRRPWLYRSLSLQQVDQSIHASALVICGLKRLQELHLQGAHTIFARSDFVLPECIGSITSLRSLTILDFPLSKVPDWMLNLVQLEYLMFRGTDIRTVPEDLKELKNLRVLRIENCAISQVPSAVKGLRKLRTLGISDTAVVSVAPSDLPPQLKTLLVAGTPFRLSDEHNDLRSSLPSLAIIP